MVQNEENSEAKEEKKHDRAVLKKYALTIAACLFSVMSFAIAINLVPILFAPLRAFYQLEAWHFGLLIAVSFGSQMIVLLSCSKVPDKVGMRPVLLITASLTVVGFLLLFLSPFMFSSTILAGLLIAAIVYGVAAGFMTTMLNPIVNNLPFKNKKKVLTLFHTSFAVLIMLAIIGTTLMNEFLPSHLWNYIPLIWIVMPLTCFILWTRAKIIQPNRKPKKLKGKQAQPKKDEIEAIIAKLPTSTIEEAPIIVKEGGLENEGSKILAQENIKKSVPEGGQLAVEKANIEGAAVKEKVKNKGSVIKQNLGLFVLLLAASMVAMATEAIISKGSSFYIDEALSVPKLIGDLLGPVMFAFGLGLGRLLFGFFGGKLKMKHFMIYGSLACVVLYLLAVFTPVSGIGVAALALVGFFISLLVPGMLVKTGADFAAGGVFVFVLLNAANKVGAAGGPALFGFLTDAFSRALGDQFAYTGFTPTAIGLRTTLLICAIFPLLSFVLQLFLHRKKVKEKIGETISEGSGIKITPLKAELLPYFVAVASEAITAVQIERKDELVSLRSSIKPFFVKFLIADNEEFSQKELCVMASSHAGEKQHTKVLEQILQKCEIDIKELSLKSLKHCCSGKHIAMLIWCKKNGIDSKGYYKLQHPVQQHLLSLFKKEIGDEYANKIEIGVDACGVPCYSTPLSSLARLYYKMAVLPEYEYIKNAIISNPFYIAGTNKIETQLIEKHGIIVKSGVGNIYGIAAPQEKIGVAIKLEDENLNLLEEIIEKLV